jgi:hypothetical protein
VVGARCGCSGDEGLTPLLKVLRKRLSLDYQHFAAHGSPRAGHNAAPFMGRGVRQVLAEMLVPFKAVVDLGGVKGVMMYSVMSQLVTRS